MEAIESQELAEITVKVDESRIAEFQKLAEEFGVQHISIKADFGASTPKNPKVEFGTPPKSPNVDFGTHFMMSNADFEPPTPSSSNNIDGNISKSADGAICTCNVCGKILSCMSSARRHYKTTHEVMLTLFLDRGVNKRGAAIAPPPIFCQNRRRAASLLDPPVLGIY